MTDWRQCCLSSDANMHEAISQLDRTSAQIILVVEDNRLVGTVTDGDIRRGILRGVPMSVPVTEIMNSRPVTVGPSATAAQGLHLMRERRLHQLPVVDETGRVLDLWLIDDLAASQRQDSWVVLMAGGFGSRLRPLTDETPKPLLPVGGRPLLEIIVERFVAQGFRQIFVSLKYLAEQFEAHFGDGAALGAHIEYLRESVPLGTAGALSLLPRKPDVPVIVMNSDLLTAIDFRHLLHFHQEHQAAATMGVIERTIEIPYGVVDVDGPRISQILEKPRRRYLINAGIYVLSPETLERLPQGQRCDMPTLFTDLAEAGWSTCAFPIREYWLDIGQMADLERARGDYTRIFGG